MKGVCGIDIDRDKIFISFAAINRGQPLFMGEAVIESAFQGGHVAEYLKENAEHIEKAIKEKEKEFSLEVEKVFLNLPWGMEKHSIVEEIFPLKGRKKITVADIDLAKKYIEDSILDWDDRCLHHFILSYEVEGKTYTQPPLGVLAKKIKLKSMLVYIKEKLHKEVKEIFYNLERVFGGFVAEGISSFASSFNSLERENKVAVVNVCYDSSYCMVYSDGNIVFGREFDFSFRKILQEVSDKFSVPLFLSEEIFDRYVSFKETAYQPANPMLEQGLDKEVALKNGDSYVNISTLALNSLVKKYIKDEVLKIAEVIVGRPVCVPDYAAVPATGYSSLQENSVNSSATACLIQENSPKFSGYELSLVGRLGSKEGFYRFLSSFIPADIKVIPCTGMMSSSFGCLRYGLFRFLENDYRRKESIVQKVLKIYKEYF